MAPKFAQLFVSALVLLTQLLSLADARNIGVCYGLNGNNLPSPTDVINLYKRSQIDNIRIYEPYPEVLQALRGSGLSVAIGPRNEDIASFAGSQDAANAWVNKNIVPYKNDVSFKWITIGNEVIPGPLGANVPAAMNNIRYALSSVGLTGINVTTVLAATALGASFPPSAGAFASDITGTIASIAGILAQENAPLMVNVYPYFAYSSDPIHISAEYALFNSTSAVVTDGSFQYFNLFDAMCDAFNAALEKINFAGVKLAVAETGWPSVGNPPFTSVANAQTYNKNLMNHVLQNGTPRRPSYLMDAFFFEMFNENLKENAVEQNFGFFFPNMAPVYPFW
ncbi:putative glucan endo-1,3-beta-glucosidase GVI [Herrania umbratica]|uniref:glucan endo-1,3-beta-D-glucosidase n=1 Tax=Herrania umbratica TaxID=108875 RepID=A0A6J1AE73_9ROSI|nr:putative glucan endo-1,3-beta-glucosidase GVI [Herrania umbratica]